MSGKWTPGPWSFSYDNEVGPDDGGFFEFNTVYAKHYEEIGRIYDTDNARLIAAAPDLYEALEAMQSNAVIRSVCPSPLWGKMVDALAKARGEA